MGKRPLGPHVEGRTNSNGAGGHAMPGSVPLRPLTPRGPRWLSPAVMAEFIIIKGLIRMKSKVIPRKNPNNAPEDSCLKTKEQKKNERSGEQGGPRGMERA